eukprot:10102794-Prorocentrum_lima.AAC.1
MGWLAFCASQNWYCSMSIAQSTVGAQYCGQVYMLHNSIAKAHRYPGAQDGPLSGDGRVPFPAR